MAQNSKIEWTDHTWNPWLGCRKVSSGCKHCYMFRIQERYGQSPTEIRRASLRAFEAPLRWKKPAKVFTCSMSDFFIEEADEWREEAWEIIRKTPHLTYQILTKRPQNILKRLPADWGDGYPNVWLGVSAEDQLVANVRIPILLSIPARVRFISFEPLLGPIYFLDLLESENDSKGSVIFKEQIHWVITGGESGPKARKADPFWFNSIKNQCRIAGIPFFHKQNGGNRKINGSWGGRKLFGMEYNEFPGEH